MTCKGNHVLVLCPICQLGPIFYAGPIVSRVCDGCKKLK